jgi:tetratricopeptide (TPR) repeat protein
MLRSAASMDGQSAVALQAARDLARRFPFAAMYEPLTLARFGRWDEILALAPLVGDELEAGMSFFARGLAYLGTGKPNDAEAQLALLDAMRAAVPDSAKMGAHPIRTLLGIARGILAGEHAASRGKWDDAISSLNAAIPLEDSLRYDEPEPWPIPVRQVLGAVLLEAGRAADAETAFRQELTIHTGNGWSLFGLTQALRVQGRHDEAAQVSQEFAAAWGRADVWLTGARVRPRPPESR